jgi:hypothetical protein
MSAQQPTPAVATPLKCRICGAKLGYFYSEAELDKLFSAIVDHLQHPEKLAHGPALQADKHAAAFGIAAVAGNNTTLMFLGRNFQLPPVAEAHAENLRRMYHQATRKVTFTDEKIALMPPALFPGGPPYEEEEVTAILRAMRDKYEEIEAQPAEAKPEPSRIIKSR